MSGLYSRADRQETKSLLSLLVGTNIHVDTTQNAQRLIDRAASNRVLYTLAQAIARSQVSGGPLLDQPMHRIARIGDTIIDQHRRTLSFVTELLNDNSIPSLLIKTCRTLTYISDDLDIIVPRDQYSSAILLLTRHGAQTNPSTSRLYQAHLTIGGLQTIDLHKNMRWWNAQALSDEFVWSSPRPASFLGVPCVIPNREVELAARALDSGWQRQSLGILDVLDIQMLCASANVDRVHEEASRFGWADLFGWLHRWVAELAAMLGDPTVTAQGRLYMTADRTGSALPTPMPVVFPWTRALRIMAEHVASGHAPVFREYLYLAYARARFHLTSGHRIAMLGQWHRDLA